MMALSEADDGALPAEKFIAKIWQERRQFVRTGGLNSRILGALHWARVRFPERRLSST